MRHDDSKPSLRTRRFDFNFVGGAVGGIAGLAVLAGGCQQRPHYPPPRAPGELTYSTTGEVRERVVKPLPDPARAALPGVPYTDPAIVTQQIPEARRFVEAYRGANSPRIAVFVNRTLDGDMLTAGNGMRPPADGVERRRPVSYAEADAYLRPGEYDELAARSIDYAALEARLADWLAVGGQVRITAPTVVRERMTEDEVRRLSEGRPRALSEVAKALSADILVQVQARPTRQTPAGLEVRLIAEAINLTAARSGESMARAVTRMEPPLTLEQINDVTRFVARKLMNDMATSWAGPGVASDLDPPDLRAQPPARNVGVTGTTPAPESSPAVPALPPAEPPPPSLEPPAPPVPPASPPPPDPPLAPSQPLSGPPPERRGSILERQDVNPGAFPPAPDQPNPGSPERDPAPAVPVGP